MRKSLQTALLTAFIMAGLQPASTLAAEHHKTAAPASASTSGDVNGFHLPSFPADAHVSQSTRVDGRTLKYTVTVGSLPVRDDKGTVIGQVMYTAYTMPGRNRPVTFAVNGGPGASSVFLNFGAIGPKKVDFGVEGDTPSEPAVLHDNPGTWLGTP